jgi:hypothetical protein
VGIGDALMAAGEARRMHKSNGLPVLIVDRRGRPTWYDVWEGIPYIVKRPGGRPFTRIVNGGGVRPYIAAKTPTRWTWKPYRPYPAELRFTPAEMAFAEPYRGMVMLEPNGKNIGHANKLWPMQRWAELVEQINVPLVQCVSEPGPHPGVKVLKVITPAFRQACAVLSVAKAFVGTDGGLMHAAAATGTPAVILWSEYTSPEIVGYSTMTNLRHAGAPCGNRLNCPGCRKAMEAITVAEVVTALKGILK